MKNTTAIEIQLSGKDETITFPQPCIYCGDQVPEGIEFYENQLNYELSEWRLAADTGNLALFKLVDDKGRQKAKVKLEIPYCTEHKKGVVIFSILDGFFLVLGAIVGAIAGFFVAGILETGISIFDIILFVVFIGGGLIVGAGLFSLLCVLIKKTILLFIKKYDDFSVWNGHWGLEVEPVRIENNDATQGPVEYFLPISLTNANSVDRVLKTFPRSKIVKPG